MTSQLIAGETAAGLTTGRGRGPGGQLTVVSLTAGYCPVADCHEQIDASRLMCKGHWYLVPKQLRDRVWATWRSGAGAHGAEHREAVLLAVAAARG